MSAKKQRRKGPLTIHRLFLPCLGAAKGFHYVTISVGRTGQLFGLTSDCQNRPEANVVLGLAPDTPLCLTVQKTIVADIERPCVFFKKLATSDATFSDAMDVAHRRAVEIRALRHPCGEDDDSQLLVGCPYEEYRMSERIREISGLKVSVGVAREYRVVRLDGVMVLAEMGGVWRPVVPVKRLSMNVLAEIARRLNEKRPPWNWPDVDTVTDDILDVQVNGCQP